MGSTSQQTVQATIESAVSQGSISSSVAATVVEELDDIAIAGCDGVDIDDIDSEEVTLVCTMIDASYSMQPHQQALIDAYNNDFLKSLQGAKNAKSILAATWVFSAEGSPADYCRLIHGWTDIPSCPKLTPQVYNPDGGTPLWQATFYGLTGIMTYGQTLRDGGTRTKCIAIVLSDGEENSSNISASKVRQIAEELLRQEYYILAYAFFGDASEGDKYAKEIGFPAQHRLTAGLSNADIRRVFGTASASVISTSQQQVSAGSLSANAFFVSP